MLTENTLGVQQYQRTTDFLKLVGLRDVIM